MAVRKSTLITNLDATPPKMATTRALGGDLKRQAYNSAKGSGDATADIYPVLRAWTGWTLDSLVFQTEAWGTSGVVEIGCYDTAANGGAVIDADAFGSAINVASALARIDLLAEASTQTPDRVNTKLRDILGLAATADDKWVDICLLATNIGAAQAAKFSLTLRYIEN